MDQSTDSNLQNDDVEHNERDRKANDEEDLSRRSIVESTEEQVSDSDQTREQPSTIQDTGTDSEAVPEVKKNLELPEESKRLSEEELDELDEQPEWKEAKQRWKESHPTEKIKNYKMMYLKGVISKLPWEAYLQPNNETQPDQSGYIQNEEQSQDSIWSRIKKENE